MDLTLSPIETEWQERARSLGDRVISPRAAYFDRRAEFPLESFAALSAEGFLKLAAPRDYGGLWCGYMPYALAALEIARCDPSVMCMLAMHFGCVAHLLTSGDSAQRQRYLSEIVGQGRFFGVATSPSSTDGPGTRASVRADVCPGGWRLNGRRHFVTGAGVADWLIVLAELTDGERLFIVEQKANPAVRVERPGEGLGLRASATYNVVFEDCFVANQDQLKARAGGFGAGVEGFYPLAGFAIGLSATVLGPAIAACEFTRETLRQLTEKGVTVSQERKRLLGEMFTDLEGARALLFQAAWAADHDPAHLVLATQAARFACTRSAVEVTQKAMLACGGRSYLDHTPLERHVRDALAGPLQAGCHESCPERVAAELLGRK